jgi:choice-of-anchor C domain-containing protein
MRKGLGFALFCVLAVPFAVRANLVLDGSFEGQVATQPFQTFYAPSSFGAWTVTAGSIDLINGYWAAAEGNQSVDLSGTSRGTIQQTVNIPGGSYHLTFELSGNSDGPPTVKTVLVSLGGVSAQFSFTTPSGNNQNMHWVSESWDVYLPAGGNTVLSFADISDLSATPNAYGAALDNISLTSSPVPETSTFLAGACLMIPLGLSALRILWRTRAKLAFAQVRSWTRPMVLIGKLG